MKILGYVGILALLAVGVAFPQVVTSPTNVTIAINALIFATMATGWNILGGYTGYISLGHIAFFGIGAYALGLVSQHFNVPGGYEPFFLLPVAGLIAAAFAVPLGIITLRTRRHVFVVLTIAMLFIGQLVATNLHDLTGGSSGMALPTPPWLGESFNIPFYYAALTVLIAAVLVSWWIRRSKFGLALLAIRDDEDRALGLGVNAGLYKLVCFVLAAFFIGMAGGIWAYFQTYIYPQFVFDPLFDISMVLMTFAGGVGTLAGPVLGALLIEPAHEYFAVKQSEPGLYLILYGALLLVIILLLPQGIVPTIRNWLLARGSRRPPAATPPAIESAPVTQHTSATRESVKR
jgi:branched-chain amino acid transport system permease protein